MNKVQTDNDYFFDKVCLRLNNLPAKKEIIVLDMFSGRGRIWEKIRELSLDKKIVVLRVDKKKSGDKFNLVGDNRKFFSSLDL